MAEKNMAPTEERTPTAGGGATRGAAAEPAKQASSDAPAQQDVALEPGDGAVNEPIADEDVPPPIMEPGMLRIRLHGGSYERDVTVKEWTEQYGAAKNIGRWDIVHTSVVDPNHSDAEAIA